jgi:hypothetical protein
MPTVRRQGFREAIKPGALHGVIGQGHLAPVKVL